MNLRLRNIAFWVLAIGVFWLVSEILALLVHSAVERSIFSLASFRSQLELVARGETPVDVPSRDTVPATGRRGRGSWSEVIHPYLGVVVDPDQHRPGAVSELGFVNSPPLSQLAHRPPGTRTIAILGGSFAVGVFRQAHEASQTRTGTPSDRIVNLAKAGYKQPQQLMTLAYLLALGAEFDLVVNIDGFNEVALPPVENVPRGLHPFYPRQWHVKARELVDSATLRKVGYLEYLSASRSKTASRLLESSFSNSPLALLIWRAVDLRHRTSIEAARKEVEHSTSEKTKYKLSRQSRECLTQAGIEQQTIASLGGIIGRVYDDWDALMSAVAMQTGSAPSEVLSSHFETCAVKVLDTYAVFGPDYPFEDQESLAEDSAALWKRASIELDALCRAHGIRYFHFLQPNQYVEGSKPMTAREAALAINAAQPYRRGAVIGYPRLQRSASELVSRGVRFTDLSMIFEREQDVMYADDCCHLNKKGYARVWQSILETIAKTQETHGDANSIN